MTGQTRTHSMNDIVLARLTGGLGDARTLDRYGTEIGHLYGEFLPDVFESETGLRIGVHYGRCESGRMSDLVAGIGGNHSLVNASLRNWCPNFVLACGNALPITMMAHMLGALPDDIAAPEERPLSKIELDAAALVFDKVAGVLRSGVNAPGGFEPILSPPCNSADRPEEEEERDDPFALAVHMRIELEPVEADLILVIPQQALLKTKITPPKSGNHGVKARKEWTDQLAEQVRRSHVTLEARIKLTPLTLRTIAHLAPGDVIPFLDHDDVHVDVNANGKELYACEFGRSGQSYTVRIKGNTTSDEELLRHLIKG